MIRSPDPLRARRTGWLCRRIAPDCVKLDLDDLGTPARERKLFEWMGAETANTHLGSSQRVPEVAADLKQRGEDWLDRAAATLAEAARDDWKAWRRHDG